MICVKPQDLKKVLAKNATDFQSNHLVLSIAAGTQLAEIEKVRTHKCTITTYMENFISFIWKLIVDGEQVPCYPNNDQYGGTDPTELFSIFQRHLRYRWYFFGFGFEINT